MRKICQVMPSGLAYILDISLMVHHMVLCHLSGCQDPVAWYHAL